MCPRAFPQLLATWRRHQYSRAYWDSGTRFLRSWMISIGPAWSQVQLARVLVVCSPVDSMHMAACGKRRISSSTMRYGLSIWIRRLRLICSCMIVGYQLNMCLLKDQMPRASRILPTYNCFLLVSVPSRALLPCLAKVNLCVILPIICSTYG